MTNTSNSSWSQITLRGVSPEKTRYNQAFSLFIGDLREIAEENYQGGSITINDRSTTNDVHLTEKLHTNTKGEKNFYRERNIPQKKNKNYPTKPQKKGDDKISKDKCEQEYFHWEFHHAQQEVDEVYQEIEKTLQLKIDHPKKSD